MTLLLALACRPAVDPPSDGVGPDDSKTETGIVKLDDSEDTQTSGVEHVIIIVMDGARMQESFGTGTTSNTTGEATEDFMPEIRSRLFPEGTLVLPGIAPGITTTGPSHCDLLIGTNTPYGNYGVDAATRDPGLYRPEYPTLFEAARAQKGWSDDEVRFGANAALMYGLTWSLHPAYGEEFGAEYTFIADPENAEQPLADDLPVMEALQDHVDEHEARLIIWNLKNVDRTGHYGPGESYPNAVKVIDDPIADFWDWLQANETYAGNTVLVLTSDHGRHDFDREEDWRQHGDSCRGCREVPMFLVGPGIEAGETVTDFTTLHDLTQTVAEMLDLSMPHSTGRSLTGDGAEGTLEISGGSLTSTYTDGRPTIVRDGEVVSSGWGVTPRVAGDYACFAELDPTSTGSLPWVPRCLDAEGTDIGFADEPEVSAWFAPDLVVEGEYLWATYADTKNGVVVRPSSRSEAVRLVRWSSANGWEGMGGGTTDFSLATHPALARDGESTWVAFASADPGTTDRSSRHIKVYKVAWNDEELPIWNKAHDTLGEGRMERPDIAVVGDTVYLSYLLSRSEFGNTVMLKSSSDGGETWTETLRIDDSGRVLAHVGPQLHDTQTWWARLGDEGTVEVCSRALAAQEPTCTDTGAAALRTLSVSDEGVFATVSEAGDRSWTTWSP